MVQEGWWRSCEGAMSELHQHLPAWEAPPATRQGLDAAPPPRVTPGNLRALGWGHQALVVALGAGGKLAGR